MTNFSSLFLLLEAIAQLLAFVAANPGISPEMRENALRLADRGVTLAQEAVVAHQQRGGELSPPADRVPQGSQLRIVPKPEYDLRLLERRIHSLINDERSRLLLRPLELDETVSRVARAHSEDQAVTNRLTTSMQKPCVYPIIRHEGLTEAGIDLAERLDFRRILFRRAGENIAALSTAKNFMYRAPIAVICPSAPIQKIPPNAVSAEARRIVLENIRSAEAALLRVAEVEWINQEWHGLETIALRAVTGWIESPGHYANIANEHFTRTGIGAAEVNRYIIITQVFVEPSRR